MVSVPIKFVLIDILAPFQETFYNIQFVQTLSNRCLKVNKAELISKAIASNTLKLSTEKKINLYKTYRYELRGISRLDFGTAFETVGAFLRTR